MVAFKDAFNLTTATIDRRTFHYRNLVILVVLIIAISLVGAKVFDSAIPMAGLFFLVPLCGGFFWLDAVLVSRWRERILRMWIDEQLDLDGLVKAVNSVRVLPTGTVQGMLGGLPTSDKVPDAGKLSPAMKQALATTLRAIGGGENDRVGFASLAYLLGAVVGTTALVLGSWLPLTGILLAVPLFGIAWCVKAARWRSWRQALATLQSQHGLELKSYCRLAAKLNWGSVPEKEKRQRIDSLC
jgi:hypothetical protein